MTWSKAKVGTNVCFLSLITLKPEECLKNYLVKRYIAWLAFYPYKLPSGSPDQLPKIMFRIISILAWDVSAYAELTTHLMQMIHNHNRWFDHELVLNIYKKSKNQKLQVFQHFFFIFCGIQDHQTLEAHICAHFCFFDQVNNPF